MFSTRRWGGLILLVASCAAAPWAAPSSAGPSARPAAAFAAALPDRLSDQAFWRLSAGASEPGGYFRSQDITNLTSNELLFQHVIPDLLRRTSPGAVYLGVGPEQNFTYIAAVRPKLAVVFDIRRGNLDLQLMYKAIFELAEDRAAFVAMLFGTSRLAGVTERTDVETLFRALDAAIPNEAIHRQHLLAIEDRLTKVHRFPLRGGDLAAIRAIYQMFHYNGVAIRRYPNYADLMTATDRAGARRSFLASEEAFAFVRDLQLRNLVVPVVGDFAGPKAIRAVGDYLREQGATVGAFYLSNVEDYLYPLGRWEAFCRNVATLPLDASSTFIRSSNGGGYRRAGGFVVTLGQIPEEIKSCRN